MPFSNIGSCLFNVDQMLSLIIVEEKNQIIHNHNVAMGLPLLVDT